MIKIAIVGTGGMGRVHSDCYHSLQQQGRSLSVIAAADIVIDKTAPVLTTHPDARAYDSLEALLAAESPDMVAIATPSHLHAEMAQACLAAGAHVFCEKPMALSTADAQAVVEAASRHQRWLMIGQVVRFMDTYRYLQQKVQDGSFGALLGLRLWRSSGAPQWGERSWFLEETLSGRAPVDFHIHDTDFIVSLLGAPQAVESRLLDDGEQLSYMYTHYQYPDVEVRAEGGWVNGSLSFNFGYEAIFANAVLHNHNDDLTLYESGKEPLKVDVNTALAMDTDTNLSDLGPYVAENDYFLRCIERGEAPALVTPESALTALAVVMQEIESARLGKAVTLAF
jgi:predicted dehydrogenase